MRSTSSIPTLRLHKPSGRYYVWDAGLKARRYLGTDAATAQQSYQLLVASIRLPEADERPSGPPSLPMGPVALTVKQALELYVWRHARGYFKSESQFGRVRVATGAVCDRYGHLPAAAFTLRHLKDLQTRWLEVRMKTRAGKTWSRSYVNKLIASVRRAFLWLATEDVIPAANAQALLLLPDVRKGYGGRETLRITPAPAWAVDATIEHCWPTLAAMIRLQRAAGMRPQDVCHIRPCDVSLDPQQRIVIPGTASEVAACIVEGVLVGVFVPESHKTLSHGKPRVVALGPDAQAIIEPYLKSTDPTARLFSPARMMAERFELRREARATPVQPSQIDRRKDHSQRTPTDRFLNSTYARALKNAILRANSARKNAGLPAIPHWAPNQLRHDAGTRYGELFDKATAAAVLGHAGLATIDVYMEQSLGKAMKAAAKAG